VPVQKVLDDGTIKLKNNELVKIIKARPINYNLKSDFEKEVILNSYKNLFLNINFKFQILIQSKKEDLSQNIENIRKNTVNEILSNKYINYIEKFNENKKSTNKNYFIILKEKSFESDTDKIPMEKLNENYLKIKELLFKCGNKVEELNKDDVTKILHSFFSVAEIGGGAK